MKNAAQQLMDEIKDLTTTLEHDQMEIQRLLTKNVQTAARLKLANEELNTLKYQNIDLSAVPWAELLTVDNGGNTNKELINHLKTLMEGKMGLSTSGYNIHTLQTTLQIYINHDDVSDHYKKLLTRAIDTLIPHIKPVDLKYQNLTGRMISIVDPSLSEFGSYQALFMNNSWSITHNRRYQSYNSHFNSTKELVEHLCQSFTHTFE